MKNAARTDDLPNNPVSTSSYQKGLDTRALSPILRHGKYISPSMSLSAVLRPIMD
jgi:hypothetical protein